MPRDAVIVHVVEHAQARLVRLVDVVFRIVGLAGLLVAGLAPGVVSPAGWDLPSKSTVLQIQINDTNTRPRVETNTWMLYCIYYVELLINRS